jgi:malate dehydrogenase
MFQRSSLRAFKVAVLGGAGGIGQPLSLLMKQNPMVSELSVYDIVAAPGVAADLGHISTPAKVKGYLKDDIKGALDGCDVVLIPAGVPRKPGMTRDDLFNTNATIVKNLVSAAAQYCPKATLLVISNPVNSTVPIAAEVLKKANVYDPRKLFGVTTLDVVRAKTFVGQKLGMNPFDLNVTVVGGHSGPTIVPLFSQLKVAFPEQDLKELTHRVQYGGDEVVKAKDGAGSATLSMAYAGAEFANSVLKGLRGDKGLVECTFVASDIVPGLSHFSSRVELGKDGVEKIHGLGQLTSFEEELLEKCKVELKANIEKGVAFGQK